MAISQASLSAKFQTNLKSLYGNPNGNNQMFIDFCDMLAKSVVDEIQENLTANVTIGDLTLTPTGLLDGTASPITGTSDTIEGQIPAGGFS